MTMDKSMTNARIVSLNIRGFGDPFSSDKPTRILATCREMKANIVFLQETRVSPAAAQAIEQQFPEWTFFWSHKRNSRSAGVAILISSALINQTILTVQSCQKHGGQIVVLTVAWGPRTLALCNVYLPNDPRDNAAAQRHLSSLLGGLPAHTMPILGGDFNFTEDALLDKKSFCPVQQDSHHGPRQHWRQDLGNNLVDVYRYLHLDRREYTHLHPNGMSRLDRFYVSAGHMSMVKSCKIATTRSCPNLAISDHKPITLDLLLPGTSTKTARQHPRRVVGFSFRHDPALLDQFRDQVAAMTAGVDDDMLSLVALWPLIKRRIATIARKLDNSYRNRTKQDLDAAQTDLADIEDALPEDPDTWFPRLRQTRTKINTLHARLCSHGTDAAIFHPRELPSPATTRAFHHPSSTLCHPPLQDTAGRLHSTPKGCADAMIDHLAYVSRKQSTLKTSQRAVLSTIPPPDASILEPAGDLAVTEQEVARAIRRARPSQAGIDGLSVQMYRLAKASMIPLLAKLYTAIATLQLLPSRFHYGLILPFHKKGPSVLPTNYRPITLLNVDYRLLTAILNNRLQEPMKQIIDPCQVAFLRGRSIGDNLRLLQLVPHILAASQETAYLVSCDFEKAYDTVDRDFLLAILSRCRAPQGLLRWVHLILTDTQACCSVDGHLSRPRVFEAGVRQGCPLAPVLYLFVGHALLSYLQAQGLGIHLPRGPTIPPIPTDLTYGDPAHRPVVQAAEIGEYGGHQEALHLTAAQYADDLNALAASHEGVLDLLSALDVFSQAACQHLNRHKSSILPIGKERPEPYEELMGLPFVSHTKILGITFRHFCQTAIVDWDALLQSCQATQSKIRASSLSAFGKSFCWSSYGLAAVMYAAEYVAMPRSVVQALNSLSTDLIAHHTTTGTRVHVWARSTASARPQDGGLGLLPLEEHIHAIWSKWASHLLRLGTSVPWTSLAWALINRHLQPYLSPTAHRPPPPDIVERILSGLQSPEIRQTALPPPLRPLLTACRALPPTHRLVFDPNTEEVYSIPWLSMEHLLYLRSPYTLTHAQFLQVLGMGTPGWCQGTKFVPASHLSVRAARHQLTLQASQTRQDKMSTFISQVVPEPIPLAPQALMHTYRRLWKLPLPNCWKVPFWFAANNAMLTADRLHQQDYSCLCQQLGLTPRPDRPGIAHAFRHCPPARQLLLELEEQVVGFDVPHLALCLWTALPPAPNIHGVIWGMVTLAAAWSLDCCRQSLYSRQARPLDPTTSILPTLRLAVDTFWSTLECFMTTHLPHHLHLTVAQDHPFIRWDASAACWCLTRPPPVAGHS